MKSYQSSGRHYGGELCRIRGYEGRLNQEETREASASLVPEDTSSEERAIALPSLSWLEWRSAVILNVTPKFEIQFL